MFYNVSTPAQKCKEYLDAWIFISLEQGTLTYLRAQPRTRVNQGEEDEDIDNQYAGDNEELSFVEKSDFFIESVKFSPRTLTSKQMSQVKSGIQETFKNYELNFNNNKDFQITANYKKVSAYPHGDKKNKKITFIFHGLAAFTFEIRDLKTLTEQQEWRGLIRHQPAALNMRIQDDKQTLKGEGTLGDNKIKVNGLFQKSGDEENWQYGG